MQKFVMISRFILLAIVISIEVWSPKRKFFLPKRNYYEQCSFPYARRTN